MQTDALPPNLKGVFTETPLWVDLRWRHGPGQFSPENRSSRTPWLRWRRRCGIFRTRTSSGKTCANTAAPSSGPGGPGIVLTVLLVAAVVAAAMAVRSRNRTLIANSQLFARQAETAYQKKNLELRRAFGPRSFQPADTSAARRALLQSIADLSN